MIPAGFEYHRPADIASALSILQTHGDEARVIAGGHSLIPLMKLRMAEVEHLIDLQDIGELGGLSVDAGVATIGAMVTQNELIERTFATDASGRAWGLRESLFFCGKG